MLTKKSKVWLQPPRFVFRKFNVFRILKKTSNISTFLDVGCGAGGMACELYNKFEFTGKGIDFSKEAISAANNLKAVAGINDSLVFELVKDGIWSEKKKYDLVTCFEVLEHVKDDSGLFKKIVKQSNNYILISVPSKQRLFNSSDILAGHYRRYDRNDLENLIAKEDVEIIDFYSYGYPFTNWLKVARELLLKIRNEDLVKPNLTKQSKKSGVDLMNINSVIGVRSDFIFKPLFYLSLLFNNTDLGEGYLVLMKKNKK